MIPVNIDSHLDIAVVSSSSSPGVNVVIKEKHTPIPPVQGAPSSGSDVGLSLSVCGNNCFTGWEYFSSVNGATVGVFDEFRSVR